MPPPPLLAAAALAPVWYAAGAAAQAARLPALSGYLLAGALSGPGGAGALSPAALEALRPAGRGCLGLIALAAGAELRLAELRRQRRAVAALSAGVLAASWAAVYAAALPLLGALPFGAALPPAGRRAAAALLAAIAGARSPAAAVAVMREAGARGPFCSLVMSVVVAKDVAVFALFSVTLEAARLAAAPRPGGGGGLGAAAVLRPLGSLLAAGGLGAAAGAGLAWALAAAAAPGPGAPPARGRRLAAAAGVLAAAAGTFGAAELLGAEPLLACVVAGLVAANSGGGGGGGAARDAAAPPAEALPAALAAVLPPLSVAFFGLAGASLRLGAVHRSLWAATLLFAARLAGVWVGSALGGRAAGLPPRLRRPLWRGMVTQAGVALGLAHAVAVEFSGWGPDFAALAAGMVLWNLVLGPPLFKAALSAAGEARRAAPPGAGGGAGAAAAPPAGAGSDGEDDDGFELPALPAFVIPVIQVARAPEPAAGASPRPD